MCMDAHTHTHTHTNIHTHTHTQQSEREGGYSSTKDYLHIQSNMM